MSRRSSGEMTPSRTACESRLATRISSRSTESSSRSNSLGSASAGTLWRARRRCSARVLERVWVRTKSIRSPSASSSLQRRASLAWANTSAIVSALGRPQPSRWAITSSFGASATNATSRNSDTWPVHSSSSSRIDARQNRPFEDAGRSRADSSHRAGRDGSPQAGVARLGPTSQPNGLRGRE